jgi:hypothetical protein
VQEEQGVRLDGLVAQAEADESARVRQLAVLHRHDRVRPQVFVMGTMIFVAGVVLAIVNSLVSRRSPA